MTPKAGGSKLHLAFVVSSHRFALGLIQRKATENPDFDDKAIRTLLKELELKWTQVAHEFAPYLRGVSPPEGVSDDDINTSHKEVEQLYSEVRILLMNRMSVSVPSASHDSSHLLNETNITPARISFFTSI